MVRYLADEVAVMYLGLIVEHRETERIFADAQHPYTRGLLAAVPSVDPERHFLPRWNRFFRELR